MVCYRHGMAKTSFYEVWHHMKQRCLGTSDTATNKNYYLRGITYDPRWDSFNAFYEDMFSSYQQGLQLDRIDNNGPYSKNNCRWATVRQNQRNRRDTIYIEYKGEKRRLIDLCEELNIPYQRVIKRYSFYGMRTIEDLFFEGNHAAIKNYIICRLCIICGTLGGTTRASGRPIRKRGMCNTCYTRETTRKIRKLNAAPRG